jgi:hypothetical protein
VSLPTPPDFEPAWLAPDDVKAWLALLETDTADDELVVAVCAMTEPYVQRCRPEWTVDPIPLPPAPLYVPDAETYRGAVMYAAREYRRRNSPAGVQSFADGSTIYVSKYDSDIERALRTGAYASPRIG